MTTIESALRRSCATLAAADVPFALIGGLAVSLRTEPRFTRDVDFAVAVEPGAALDNLGRHFLAQGYAVAAMLADSTTQNLTAIRFQDGNVLVDLLIDAAGIEAEVIATATDIEVVPGLICAVANCPALLALKILAIANRNRPQDRSDFAQLCEIATKFELAEATKLVDKIAPERVSGHKLLSELWRSELARHLSPN